MRITGPAGVFPLGFRGQSIRSALLSTQPGAKGFRVVPAHVRHRVVVGYSEAIAPPVKITMDLLPVLSRPAFLEILSHREGQDLTDCEIPGVPDKLAELADRDFVLTQVKGPADRDFLGRAFQVRS